MNKAYISSVENGENAERDMMRYITYSQRQISIKACHLMYTYGDIVHGACADISTLMSAF